MSSSKELKTQTGEKPLREWLKLYASKWPCRRPYFLSEQDAEDVLQGAWERVVKYGQLEKSVRRSYLVAIIRNEIRRQGLQPWWLRDDKRTAIKAHLSEQWECSDDGSEQRLGLWMAGRRMSDPRHVKVLALKLEGHNSKESAQRLTLRHPETTPGGRMVQAHTIRQWFTRHIYPFYGVRQAA